MIRRINIYGGPGSGKSTLTARVFSELKSRHRDVEIVSEYIKDWAYEGRRPISYDQAFVFHQQLHAEDLKLRHVKAIVTESPLLLNNAYTSFGKFRGLPHLVAMSHLFENDFPSINFFIKRTVLYQTSGRYQDQASAIEFDKFLYDFVTTNLFDHLPLHEVTVDDFDKIIDQIEKEVFTELANDSTNS